MTFNPLRDMVMIHTCAKYQGQRSLVSKARVQRDGRTDTSVESYPTFLKLQLHVQVTRRQS